MSSSRCIVCYLIVALYCISQGHGAFYPTGCAYDTTDASMGIYECDYSLMTLPIYYSNFSDPVPQRFVLYNVEGTLPSNGTFDEFSTFNQSAITSDYTCYLEISCVDGGNLTLEAGTFFGMNYVQEFKISSCKINSLPSGVFSDFVELDHLHIEGGSIVSTSSDSLSGLSLTKLSNVPFPKGRLTIRDTNVNGNLSAGFFGSLTSVRAIDLTNSGIVTLFDTMFANNTQLRYLSLGNNGFTTIPTTLFSGLHGLTEVDFTGIAWDCSCSNLWFLDQFSSNYMRIVGGALCNSPSDYQGKRAALYYANTCRSVDRCNAIPGIAIGIDCFEWYQIFSYAFVGAIFTLAVIALAIVIAYRHKMYKAEQSLILMKKEKEIRVLEALKQGGGGRQTAPMKTDPTPDLSWAITAHSESEEKHPL